MKTKKITKQEWEAFIKMARSQEKAASQKTMDFFSITRKYLPVPIVIGVVASSLMVHFYGWRALWENLLAWIIGLTVITTFIATFQKSKRR